MNETDKPSSTVVYGNIHQSFLIKYPALILIVPSLEREWGVALKSLVDKLQNLNKYNVWKILNKLLSKEMSIPFSKMV